MTVSYVAIAISVLLVAILLLTFILLVRRHRRRRTPKQRPERIGAADAGEFLSMRGDRLQRNASTSGYASVNQIARDIAANEAKNPSNYQAATPLPPTMTIEIATEPELRRGEAKATPRVPEYDLVPPVSALNGCESR